MNAPRKARSAGGRRIWTALLLAAAVPAGAQAGATNVLPSAAGVAPASLMPNRLVPVPALSPVAFFRKLLAMNAVERSQTLATRPPGAREKLQAKIREYLAMNPDERELRLQATELRWYVAPLMQLPADQRADRLKQIPDQWRDTVQSRLQQWDALPSALRQELLTNDQALHYVSQVGTNSPAGPAEGHAAQLAAQFDRYFELTPEEKQRALNTLSPIERAQMQKTLQTFEKLPPAQRLRCLRNYATFAGMTPAERAEFLRNADEWSRMSPAQRQAWRDLVAQAPLVPVPRPSAPPQIFPGNQPHPAQPGVATN